MKRFTAFVLTGAMLISLAGCNKNSNESSPASESETTTTSATTTEEPEVEEEEEEEEEYEEETIEHNRFTDNSDYYGVMSDVFSVKDDNIDADFILRSNKELPFKIEYRDYDIHPTYKVKDIRYSFEQYFNGNTFELVYDLDYETIKCDPEFTGGFDVYVFDSKGRQVGDSYISLDPEDDTIHERIFIETDNPYGEFTIKFKSGL